MKIPATPEEIAALKSLFPEMPAWVTERGFSAKEIKDTMELRRKAFPKTRVSRREIPEKD
jgi:hypothetical protein